MSTYAYLGPKGTFTEAALKKITSSNDSLIPYANVTAALDAVRVGKAHFALVPIENSVEGVVARTLDELALEGVRGFIDLAWRLGLLVAQLDDAPLKSCSIAYRGEIASRNTKLVKAAFAAGLLESAIEGVNIVNAEMLLRERGIELEEQSRTDPGAFSSVVAVDVVGSERVHRAAGTLFGQSMPRLVQLEGHRLDAYLDGILLVFTHRDVPGIIGQIGTAFGEIGVNIAQMTVGRSTPGGDAIGVLNLDQEPGPAAIAQVLASCPGVRSAQVVKLPPAGQLPKWLSSAKPSVR